MAVKKFLKAAKDIKAQQHRKHEELKHAAEDGEGNWLISYADMMTLLCGFFIMLFSMSKLDTPKYDSFKSAVAQQFGGEYSNPTKELASFVTQMIEELALEKDATVRIDNSGVSIAFSSTVFFDTLSAEVRIPGKLILTRLIDAISARQANESKKYKIVVEGHTDSRPILGGQYPSNWELSGARAARVVRLFLERGFEPAQLTSIGYSDTRPEAPPRTPAGTWDEEALARNRRVVLRILEPGVDSIPFPESDKGLTFYGPPAPSADAAATAH